MADKCKLIKKRLSTYKVCDNPGGRKNKLRINSSEFPQEVWLAHDMNQANRIINKTEQILAFRKLRDSKDPAEKKSMREYRKELK